MGAWNTPNETDGYETYIRYGEVRGKEVPGACIKWAVV